MGEMTDHDVVHDACAACVLVVGRDATDRCTNCSGGGCPQCRPLPRPLAVRA